MADWSATSAALDNLLRDTLSGAGATSHEEVLDWAESQYTAFAEPRRRRRSGAGCDRAPSNRR